MLLLSPRPGLPQCSDNQENKKKSGEAKQNVVSNFLLICSGPLYRVTVFSTAIYLKAFILLWCKKRKFLFTFWKRSLKKHLRQFRSGFWRDFLAVFWCCENHCGFACVLLCMYLGIQFSVFSIFSILHYIWWLNPFAKPRNYRLSAYLSFFTCQILFLIINMWWMVLCFIIDYVTIKTSNGLAMWTRLDDMIAA